jgi:hypothetical protein
MLRARTGIIPHVGVMGYTAGEAVYEFGDEWNRQQCEYLAVTTGMIRCCSKSPLLITLGLDRFFGIGTCGWLSGR